MRASGKTVSSTEYRWSKLELGAGPACAGFRIRRPSRHGATNRAARSTAFEISRSVQKHRRGRRDLRPRHRRDVSTTEIGGGAHAGSSASLRVLHTGVFNDTANWCLGRTQSVQVTASHTLPGGTAIARSADQEWDGPKCRPTQIRLQPGDDQWQVTNDLSYDAFGNVAGEKVTGAAMAARSCSIEWDARGQLPVRVSDPLGNLSRYAWNAGRGIPRSFTDPTAAPRAGSTTRSAGSCARRSRTGRRPSGVAKHARAPATSSSSTSSGRTTSIPAACRA